MAKVEGKATIPNSDNRRSPLLCSQESQTLPRLSRKYLAWLILFVSSGAIWFVGGVAIAANPGSCQSKAKKEPAILLPSEKTKYLSCVTTKRSPSNSEIAQIKSENQHSGSTNTTFFAATTTKTIQQLPLSACCGQLRTISPACSPREISRVASELEEWQLLKCPPSKYQHRLNQTQAKPTQQLSFKSLQENTISSNLQAESEKIIGSSQSATINNKAWVADLKQTTLKTPITKVRLTEALTSHGKYHDQAANLPPYRVAESSDLLLPLEVIQPYLSTNIKVVPSFEPNIQSAENFRNAQPSNSKPQLKLQQAIPLSPQAQPALRAEKLNPPELNGDPELGNLRLRKLEVQPHQAQENSSELGNLRLRKLEVQPRQAQENSSELGNLRVREQEVQLRQAQADPELGTLRLRALETDSDLELGNIRVREQELPPPRQQAQSPSFKPTVRLLSQVGYFKTNNIFSGIDPVDDSLLSFGLTLWATSALGPKTTLLTAIDGSLIRYLDQTEFNYNQLRFRATVRQQLAPRMYGEFGFNNQKLFRAESGDRFLNEDSFRMALHRRDRITKKLRLDTLYEFRLSDANPESRSRIINSLSVSLSYPLKRNLQVGLDYQFGLSNFTERDRKDQYHRLLGRLNYAVSGNSQINLQTGFSFGGSSEPNIDFDNFFFSVTYTMELGKF